MSDVKVPNNSCTASESGAMVPKRNSRSSQNRKYTRESYWKVCKWYVDKRCLSFSRRTLFTFIILLFAIVQIYRDSDGCSNSLLNWYCTVIGVILGTFTNMAKDPTNTRSGTNQRPIESV